MKDYSQSGEQAAILDVFRLLPGYGFHKRFDATSGEERTKCQWCDKPESLWEGSCKSEMRGRFLDIGAYHPTVFSNTRALYELGWSGVMFEPSPGPMRALVAEYGNEPRIELVQAAVSLTPGAVLLHVTDDAVSTSCPDEYEVWREKGGYIGKLLVPALTVADILNRWGSFDFVNIDAEGVSADLFLEFLRRDQMSPCYCVEVDVGRLNEMMTAASAAGYTAKVIGANLVLSR